MRTQLIVCAVVISVLFTCGSLILNCTFRLRQSVEDERARTVALYNTVSNNTLPIAAGYLDTRGAWR